MSQLVEQLRAAVGERVDNLVVLDAVDSTHAFALRLIEQMDEEGVELRSTLILAHSQSHGVGRGSNRWASPPGGLYLSWVRCSLPSDTTALLPILAAAATCTAVADLGLAAVAIRWPNDLVVGEAKLGGILTHARHGSPPWVTIGIGVNLTVTPTGEHLAGRVATCLADHLPGRDLAGWAVPLVGNLVAELEAGLADPDRARGEWRRRLVHHVDEPMTVRLGSGEVIAGAFAGLTDEGFLRLAHGAGERVVSSGELLEGPPQAPAA